MINQKIEIVAGVFKGLTGIIREYDANLFCYRVTFADKPELNTLGWYKSEFSLTNAQSLVK